MVWVPAALGLMPLCDAAHGGRMHEFAFCEGLLKVVGAELARLGTPPPRLLRVRVVCGALRQMVPETLQLAFELLSRDTPAAGATLEVSARPARFRCRDCGTEAAVDENLFVCAACGAADVEVTAGRELYVESLEVDDEPHHDPGLP